ncbi:DUF3558 family protein [Gordonia sp. FQ]|uniref:DUF3558 family protein n=1 Tax=Gordonia sp. FQ TaxID=3446634 RepID=UPI003F83E544
MSGGAQFLRMVVLAAVLFVAATGCGESRHSVRSPRATRDSAVDEIRQRDAQGRLLPFTTVFRHRWNSANDGTPYEPCTALDSAGLVALGVEPQSVKDVAGTDGQTARGCMWRYGTATAGRGWAVVQAVGNSPSLAADKRKRHIETDLWLPDLVIDGRVVGLHQSALGGTCDTYVQSGKAAVSTLVSVSDPEATLDEICERALAFTRATIGQMPP